jgi:hypothetical protein
MLQSVFISGTGRPGNLPDTNVVPVVYFRRHEET